MDLPSSPLGELDPQFEKLGIEVAAFTFGLPGTSVREKLLQTITLDMCRAHLGLAFRMHVTAAAMHGVTYAELLAAIRFVAPYSGYPAAADALARLTEIAIETGIDTSDLGEQAELGAGSGAAGRPDIPDEWTAKFVDWQLSRAWSEDLLSRRERAIMALSSDVGQRDLDESLRRHVELALDAGLSAEDVRDVIRFCAEYGIGRAVAALRVLDNELVG